MLFGNSRTMGIYSGNRKELEADFIFSTVQTISKEENLKQFDPNHFDYIVIDETHRAGAESYQKILDHFTPSFLLGMTATPERTDGLDVFKLFDYNIAYEIRLHRALEENILSPFHYYGVTDISVDGKELEEHADFNLLISNERLNRIIEKAKIYGCDNGKVRGLVFCSTVEECKVLSDGFNTRGFKTVSLSAENSEVERVEAITRLESEDSEQKLDYIFTKDIFNEGIDIPSVNQVIMLRPTQSAIVFVQQLGRGLRRLENKDYLTVIDFIGNYKNNFLVPIALYGDTSYNKDSLRKFMSSGSSLIPGTSTINFDRISRERIFEAIDSANMQLKKDLVEDYRLLKFKLGRIPMMIDFIEHGSRDPQLYVNHSKSYFNFVADIEDSMKGVIDSAGIKLLELFANEINNSKRVEESLMLKHLLSNHSLNVKDFQSQIKHEYGYSISNETIDSCINNLNFKFVTEKHEKKLISVSEKYRINILEIDGDFVIKHESFTKALANNYFLNFLIDSIDYSVRTFNNHFTKNKFVDGFVLYRKYSRKDVFRILNWNKNPLAQNVGGYLVSDDNSRFPIFVTLNKKENVSNSIKYDDGFIDNITFKWDSKRPRKLSSPEIKLLKENADEVRISLFVQKSNDEGIEFYYVGDVKPISNSFEQTTMPDDLGKHLPVVKVKFSMNYPVEDSIYEYLTNNKSIVTNTTESEVKISTITENANPFRILPIDEINPYVNCVPLYDIKVAAGDFSELQNNAETEWIELPKSFKYSRDYFVCKITGESMNQIIPNNSWCLFRKDPGGSRDGKIVLVQHTNIQDSDFGSGFTIKMYQSKKEVTEDNWQHTSIILSPKSNNPNFKPIVLNGDELTDLKVIGVFVAVLS